MASKSVAGASNSALREVATAIPARNGFRVSCWRFTADPDARIKVNHKAGNQEPELETTALDDDSAWFPQAMGEPARRRQCGPGNAVSLSEYDAVIFFTTSTWDRSTGSQPLTGSVLRDVIAWVSCIAPEVRQRPLWFVEFRHRDRISSANPDAKCGPLPTA